MTGYKVYYNIETKQFTFDDVPSEVETMLYDSTTTWFANLQFAKQAAAQYNLLLDKVYICKDCGTPYWLSEREEEWYIEHGYTIPKRCYKCRKARKEKKVAK